MPRGVTIKQNNVSERLWVAFTYKSIRCREPLMIPVTAKNVKYAANLLAEIKNHIERKTLDYAFYFPNSPKLRIFGGAVDRKKTVLDYLEDYLASCRKRGLSPSSIEGYRKVKNVVKELHNIPIVELSPAKLKDYVVNSKLSPKTLRNRFSVLRSALAEAVTDGLVPINPIDTIKLSNYVEKDNKVDIGGSHEDIDPFTPEEVEEIYKKCRPDELNIIEFVFNTGLRPSEWSALEWGDIDFVHNEVAIKKAIVEHQIKSTKTRAGKREIPLNEVALSALRRQKESSYLEGGFVFPNKNRAAFQSPNKALNRINPDSFRKHKWSRILKSAGVRYRYPYQMRHTFATRHISQGTNLWKLAKWMGHNSPEMLFRHYGGYIEEYEKQSKNDTVKTLEVKQGK